MPLRPSRNLAVLLLAAVAFLSGCATPQVSYKTRATTDAKVAAFTSAQFAPLHVEVFELSAGGVREKRDDWTAQAVQLLSTAFHAESGYKVGSPTAADLDPVAVRELAEVHALLQVITVNHAVNSIAAPPGLSPAKRPLTYNVGPIDHLLDTLKTDGLLLVMVHDEYSTGGRKALMALGFITGAITGVMVVPAGGTTVNSAALVERDGTVLWFNYGGSQGDLRTADGARATVKQLLAGLPHAHTARVN